MTTFLLLMAAAAQLAAAEHSFDVVVYGATPGGIAAAISAARMGHTVALLEYHAHMGGMTASGLGKSDIETKEAIGGLFREFVTRVRAYYVEKYGEGSENVRLSRDGYYYEPSVAENMFQQMVRRESRIQWFPHHRLAEVMRDAKRIVALRALNRDSGKAEEFRGKIFIDGSYEGDLAAFAGCRYRLGRESRKEFGELHAGVVYQDPESRRFLPGTTGEGDDRITAYTFRLCLTTNPANQAVLRHPPPEYDRARYLGYIDDWKAGRMGPPKEYKEGRGMFKAVMGTVVRALSIAEIPNQKTDVNMYPKALGFPFAGECQRYPEASWEEREQITAHIRNLTLGLLYFLQNDPAIPEDQRNLARRYHLSKDEFTDNHNFPWQLYIREARRIVGLYTLSENDVIQLEGQRARIQPDAIAAGEFPIDSFPTRKREPGHDKVLEGYIYMLDEFTKPYQIPYRILVPEKVDGLLVPVAASTTHVAFSTIRLEPTWMAMGQAAGVAAHLAIQNNRQPRDVDVETMQRILVSQGQVLTYFKDIDRRHPAYAAMQYFGTKGFFTDYDSRPDAPLDGATAARWLHLAGRGAKLSPGEGALPRAGFERLFSNAPRRTGPVTRGEFCMALYDSKAAPNPPGLR
jgi:hypothetical protein